MYPDLPPTPLKKKIDIKVMGFRFLFPVKATVLQQNNKRSLVKDYTAWQRKPIQIQDITLGHVEE